MHLNYHKIKGPWEPGINMEIGWVWYGREAATVAGEIDVNL